MFILVVTWLNDHRPLQGFTYTIGLAVSCCCCFPGAGLGTEKFGAQIWIQVGPYQFQPAEAPRSCSRSPSPPTWSRSATCRTAGYRVLGIDLPGRRDLGPILVMWLISLAILVWQRRTWEHRCSSSGSS